MRWILHIFLEIMEIELLLLNCLYLTSRLRIMSRIVSLDSVSAFLPASLAITVVASSWEEEPMPTITESNPNRSGACNALLETARGCESSLLLVPSSLTPSCGHKLSSFSFMGSMSALCACSMLFVYLMTYDFNLLEQNLSEPSVFKKYNRYTTAEAKKLKSL